MIDTSNSKNIKKKRRKKKHRKKTEQNKTKEKKTEKDLDWKKERWKRKTEEVEPSKKAKKSKQLSKPDVEPPGTRKTSTNFDEDAPLLLQNLQQRIVVASSVGGIYAQRWRYA
jgi:hypothetical protein